MQENKSILNTRPVSQYSIYGKKCSIYYPQDSMLSFIIDRSKYVIYGKVINTIGGSIDAGIETYYINVKLIKVVKGSLLFDTIAINYPVPVKISPTKLKPVAGTSIKAILKDQIRSSGDQSPPNTLLQDASELIFFLKEDTNCISEYKNKKYFCIFPTDIWFSTIPYNERLIAVIQDLLKNK
jgi:hypothetical protein